MIALLPGTKIAGALPVGKMGGAIVSGGAKALSKKSFSKGAIKKSIFGGAKKTIGKEPIWSSGTTKGGEYLSSGDRKAIFRQSRKKINSSSSIISLSGDIVPSPEGKLSNDVINFKTLEQRVSNNEKKITMLKRIVKTHQTPFGGGPLEENNSILQDIGNALALDFSNRITQRENEIDALREGAEAKKRGGIEAGLEAVNKITNKVGKAFSAVTAPARSILDKVIGFFGNLAAGFLADKALTWLSNNKDKVTAFFGFLADHGKKLLIGLGVLIGGVIVVKLVKKVIQVIKFIKSSLFIIQKALQIARMLLRFGPRALGKVGKLFNVGGKVTQKTTEKVTKKVAQKGGFKALGMVPIIGNVIDIGMAGYRASQGDFTGAALSLGSAIPGPVGWGFAATDIGRDIVSPSEDRPKGTLGTVADTYSDLVDTTTNMDFSRNVKSQNLQPSTRGNVTVMDPIKVSDMVNNQGTADTNTDSSSEDSIPLVGAEDISNSYIPFTKDLLGVYD